MRVAVALCVLASGCATIPRGPSAELLEAHERRAARRREALDAERREDAAAARESSEPALARAVLRLHGDPRWVDRLDPLPRVDLARELSAASAIGRQTRGLYAGGIVSLVLGGVVTAIGAGLRSLERDPECPRDPDDPPYSLRLCPRYDEHASNVLLGIGIPLDVLAVALLSIGGVRDHDGDVARERWRRHLVDEASAALTIHVEPDGARLLVGGTF